jgi:hypothetical protein
MIPPPSPNPAFHSPAVLELIAFAVTDKFTNYVAETTIGTIDSALGYQSTAWNRTSLDTRRVPFKRFVWDIIRRASVRMPVLLVTLVYIARASPNLHIGPSTEDWACERVFLGALMVASKYTNDSTLKNVHWALATGVFGKRDVNRIEREFLEVLNWQLSVDQKDILAHYSNIIHLYYNPSKPSSDLPPPLPVPPTPRVAATPPVHDPQPKGARATVRMPTACHDLSSPPPLLYPMALATKPFMLKAEEAKHTHPRTSGFTGFPLPWHGKNHAMPGQHTLPRIIV